MRFNSVRIKNFMGVRNLERDLSAPITLLVGPNGAGKSSTVEAIRAAALGRIDRVAVKKHYSALVTRGERIGTVILDYEGGRCGFTLPNGAHEIEGDPAPADEIIALPYVLDVHAFAQQEEDARRAFLFKILNIQTSKSGIAKRLLKEYDCDPDLTAEIEPMLASGFDAAHKRAKESVSEARGAWRATTGEAYGSEKAKAWAAPSVENPTDESIATAQQDARAAAEATNEAMRRLGAAEAEERTYRTQRDKVADLRLTADKLEHHRARLERSQQELKEWSSKLEQLPPEPGAVNLRPPMACPECGCALTLRDGALHQHQSSPTDDHETAVKREQWKKAVELHKSTIANAERDILAAERAKVELADIETRNPVSATAVEAAQGAVTRACQAQTATGAHLKDLLDKRETATRNASRTENAAKHHAQVVAWDKLATALSPEGLRTRMVADAIGPMNRALAEFAGFAQWPVPTIASDMQIMIGTDASPYSLLSESEKWRTDVLIGLAIAHLSHLNMVMIDRFDVLDMKGRSDLIFALDDLVQYGVIEQAIIAGTLKAPPAGLPESCVPVWMGPSEA